MAFSSAFGTVISEEIIGPVRLSVPGTVFSEDRSVPVDEKIDENFWYVSILGKNRSKRHMYMSTIFTL